MEFWNGKEDTFGRSEQLFESKQWLLQCGFRPVSESETSTSNIYLAVNTLCKPETLKLSTDRIDFGEIPVGFCKVENLEITNTGPEPQKLKIDVMPLTCGFSYMGIFDVIQPGETQQFSIYFEPSYHRQYSHRFRVTGLDVVSLQLSGCSMFPEIELEPPLECLDLGYTLVDRQLEGSFSIVNKGGFLLDFKILRVHSGQSNLSETPVFTCFPSKGKLEPFQKQRVQVVFTPKVASEHFFELIEISLPNQKQTKRLFIRGTAFPDGFFLTNKFKYSAPKFDQMIQSLSTLSIFHFCPSQSRPDPLVSSDSSLVSNNHTVYFQKNRLFLAHLVNRDTKDVRIKLEAEMRDEDSENCVLVGNDLTEDQLAHFGKLLRFGRFAEMRLFVRNFGPKIQVFGVSEGDSRQGQAQARRSRRSPLRV